MPQIKTTSADLVKAARAAISEISIDDAKARMGDGKTAFLDIRDVRELQRVGTIPGSFHAPRGMLEFWVDPQSPYYKKELETYDSFVLFCASAWRSALATKTLQDMGMENVHSLAGGFTKWLEHGGAVEEKSRKDNA